MMYSPPPGGQIKLDVLCVTYLERLAELWKRVLKHGSYQAPVDAIETFYLVTPYRNAPKMMTPSNLPTPTPYVIINERSLRTIICCGLVMNIYLLVDI